MLLKAEDSGVDKKRLMRALSYNEEHLKEERHLREKITAKAHKLLKKNRKFSRKLLKYLVKMTPEWQIKAMQQMITLNDFSLRQIKYLLAITPSEGLQEATSLTKGRGLSEEDKKRLDAEKSKINEEYQKAKEGFADNSLNFICLYKYVESLMQSPEIRIFLERQYPEYVGKLKSVMQNVELAN